MARDYGRVRTSFWESESIRSLCPDVKFVGLYLLTSPHTNAIGCFRLPGAYVAHDTGMSENYLQAAFKALHGAGFMSWCERMPWVHLPKYLKHNPPENPNVWRRCFSEMKVLPVELSARATIALELLQIAAEDRMRTLSSDEKNRIEPYLNRSETVPNAAPPYPCPFPEPIHTEPTHSSDKSDASVNLDAPKARKTYARDFEEFWKAYPTDKLMSKAKTSAMWLKLSPEERAQALAAIPGFRAYCSKNKTYRPVHAVRFLSERRFDGFTAETIDPSIADEQRDKADRMLRRGKYADTIQ